MYISCLTFILTAITGSEPAWWPVQCLQDDTSCALFASLYVPMRRRCKRTLTPSTAIQTDKMSKAKEFGSCPDMYRSLNTAELRELLQNDDKMEQIIGLDEKVMSFFCFVFVFLGFFFLHQINVLFCIFGSPRIFIASRSCSMSGTDLFYGSSLPAWRPIGFPSSS